MATLWDQVWSVIEVRFLRIVPFASIPYLSHHAPIFLVYSTFFRVPVKPVFCLSSPDDFVEFSDIVAFVCVLSRKKFFFFPVWRANFGSVLETALFSLLYFHRPSLPQNQFHGKEILLIFSFWLNYSSYSWAQFWSFNCPSVIFKPDLDS